MAARRPEPVSAIFNSHATTPAIAGTGRAGWHDMFLLLTPTMSGRKGGSIV